MKPFIHEVTAIVAASPGFRPIIRRYADMITGSPPARIYLTDTEQTAEIRRLALAEDADLIVSEWVRDPSVTQRLLRLAQELKLPAVFIRPGKPVPVGRLVVVTGGGPNVSEQMWIAGEISSGLGLPLEILHGQTGSPPCNPAGHNRSSAIEQMLLDVLGIQADVRQFSNPDFAAGVAGCLREDDLLIMGAPSPLRWAASFEGSLPDKVSKRVENTLILLSSPSTGRVNLRSLFWGRLITPQMTCKTRDEALCQLVDNLIQHNQLPIDGRPEILKRVLHREEVMSSAVDCETAFPHVRLPGFFGVAGSLGILPAGINFGSKDGSLSRFIFLLVTPEGFSDEYQTVLAKIAKRMIHKNIRKALLRCKTHEQALDILEPDKKTSSDHGVLSGNEVTQ